MRQSFAETWRLIRADIDWRCLYERKKRSPLTRLRLMFHPGSATVVLFRWQRFFDTNHLGFLATICRWLNLILFTSSYSSGADVAGGFLVVHATAVCVDEGVVIGPRCILFAQNAISRSPFVDGKPNAPSGVPIVDSDVVFGIGASAHGAIRIGRGMVGAERLELPTFAV
jgi:serine acetyltransferase